MKDQKPTLSVVRESQRTLSPEFLQCLAKWMTVYTHVYRQPMTEATVWAYRETLNDLSPDELDYGCKEAMRQTKFTPTPAEIREHALFMRGANHTETPLNALPPAPPMTEVEAKEFLNMVRSKIPWMNKA